MSCVVILCHYTSLHPWVDIREPNLLSIGCHRSFIGREWGSMVGNLYEDAENVNVTNTTDLPRRVLCNPYLCRMQNFLISLWILLHDFRSQMEKRSYLWSSTNCRNMGMSLNHSYITASVAETFIEHIYRIHGLPSSVVCDHRHPIFLSSLCGELFRQQRVSLCLVVIL